MNTDINGFREIPDTPISRAGIFEYLGCQISKLLEPNKIYKVYRPESELNNPKTIDSFKLLSWLDNHTMIGDGHTPAENAQVQGVTGENVYFKDGKLFANLKLFGTSLANKIKNGMQELSCGFRCTWDIEAGVTPAGERYDVVQRNILGNHLASVQHGRAGSEIRVALDSVDTALDYFNLDLSESGASNNHYEVEMNKEEILELIKIAVDEAVKEAMDLKDAELGEEEDTTNLDSLEPMKEEEEEEESKALESEEQANESKACDTSLDIAKALEELKAEIASLHTQKEAIDSTADTKVDNSDKAQFVDKVTALVGEFKHADMTKSDVAKYAINKLGLACDESNDPVAFMKGVIASQKSKQTTIDAIDNAIKKPKLQITKLDEVGL